jgi:translocation and assembly module TamA
MVVELRGTDKVLGSTFDFLQTRISARYIRSLSENSRALLRLNVGYTETSNFSRLPPTSRFFAGGDESVRGFQFDSIGPKDADGNVIGGQRLLVGSIEYEHRLFKNYHGALFVDAGNAFNGSTLDAEVGVGFGIKWRSPLGPLRLYVGFPVSDNTESPRLHLRLGADL